MTFADLTSEGFELRLIEGEVEGYQDGPLDSKKFFTGSVGPDSGQKAGVEAMHRLSVDRQQFRMLCGYQGADEVERQPGR